MNGITTPCTGQLYQSHLGKAHADNSFVGVHAAEKKGETIHDYHLWEIKNEIISINK